MCCVSYRSEVSGCSASRFHIRHYTLGGMGRIVRAYGASNRALYAHRIQTGYWQDIDGAERFGFLSSSSPLRLSRSWL
jgi:hypothetical protein